MNPTHRHFPFLIWLCWVYVQLSIASPSRAQTPHALLDLALQHQDAHRYGDAARVLDAIETPHPLYRLAAAEAWALSGELTSAETRLAEVLSVPDLPVASRVRAESWLARVRAASPHVARARILPPAEAAVAWQTAFDAADIGHFLVQACLAWEAAAEPQRAFRTLTLALRRPDLPASDAEVIPARLAALQALLPPPPADQTGAWIVTGVGVAALLFGATSMFVATAHGDDVDAALSRDPVIGMSRAQAQHRLALADDWRLAGWVGVGVGLAATTAGVLMLALDGPEPMHSVHLATHFAASSDGFFLSAQGNF